MIKLSDLMKAHGKFEQGVVYPNPYHTAFAPQIAEAKDAKFDFAQASGVEFIVSSPKNNIVLLPKSMKDREKIDVVLNKLGDGADDDFLSLLKIRIEKKLGITVIPNKRYEGAGYAFDIDIDELLKKL
jgi:hypothetical protein